MLHCGWRGLAAGIIARGAAAIGATDAAIGPGIGACCYEVGEEVLDAFAGLGTGLCGRAHAGPERGGQALAGARLGVERIESAGLCTSCEGSLFFSHRRDGAADRTPGRRGLDRGAGLSDARRLIHGLDAGEDRGKPGARQGGGRQEVEILLASKYVPMEEMGALAEAGVRLVGENRQQDLAAKQERWGEAFAWDFIGNLQSRKVKQLCRSLPPDPLGGHRLGARGAPAPRPTRDRDPGRGERGRRGGQGGNRPERAGGLHRAALRCGSAA